MRKKKNSSGIVARGFFRLQIGEPDETGKIVKVDGDSGWRENMVVNTGFRDYLCLALAGNAGSQSVNAVALGTGTAPASDTTALPNELTDAAGCRCTGANLASSTVASKTIQFAFTLNSNIITATRTIQNVGLFNSTAVTAGSIFAGNTYTTSTLATNQAVNGTYQIRFATA